MKRDYASMAQTYLRMPRERSKLVAALGRVGYARKIKTVRRGRGNPHHDARDRFM